MKVLFLDIDGVMNNEDLLYCEGMNAIGEIFLDRLKHIVLSTDVKIVLSSSWRIGSQHLVADALATRNLELFDITPGDDSVERCEEILEWLNGHPEVINFAILDDNYGAKVENHFFKTSFFEGLTEEIAEQVIKHFG